MTHVHEKELCIKIHSSVLPTSRFARLLRHKLRNKIHVWVVMVSSSLLRFRYITQTVLQHIININHVFAVLRLLELSYCNGRRPVGYSHFFLHT